MAIVDEDVERVRQASDLVEVVSKHVALRKVGRRWTGLCPFHAERTPSFSVNGEDGLYYCFGCQARGDVISFVRQVEQLDFVGAVEWLAARSGITLRYTSAGEGKERQRRKRLVEAVSAALDWYHERLLSAPDAAPARGYLRSRGYDGDIVREYKLGWAPDEWDALSRALNLPDDVLRDTGLGFLNRRNRQQDSFRARVLFPISDVQGDPVAFGGRVLPGGDGPKYKNSSDTSIYAKGRVLYGLDRAKSAIVAADEVIICEGYTDVIGFGIVGLPRAVATCGTALTEDHLRSLRSFARRIVLAFDADAAGQAAADRVYEWERRFDLDVSVAAMPKGSDPADLARTDPDVLRAAVEGAVPLLGFRVGRVLDAGRLSTPEGRTRAAEAALDVIREHPNELVRDQYVMQVAARTQQDPERLRAVLARAMRTGTVAMPTETAARRSTETAEVVALRLLVHRWDDAAPYLSAALFTDGVALDAFRALAATSRLQDAIDVASPEAADLLARLDQEPDQAAALDPAVEIGHLITNAAQRRLTAILAGPNRPTDVADVRRLIDEVREQGARSEAAAQLLGWIEGQDEER
ncbi:MAG TPA: DNA primase [Acidimicrobiales bacterium]|nr:DNA primase [Acidimicrobiales bacterium]